MEASLICFEYGTKRSVTLPLDRRCRHRLSKCAYLNDAEAPPARLFAEGEAEIVTPPTLAIPDQHGRYTSIGMPRQFRRLLKQHRSDRCVDVVSLRLPLPDHQIAACTHLLNDSVV